MADATNERTVSDVMLRNPKTLPSEVTAAEARAALEREGTYVVLLVDGSRFCGAVTEVPADADPGDRGNRAPPRSTSCGVRTCSTDRGSRYRRAEARAAAICWA